MERFKTTRDAPDFGGVVVGNKTSDRSSRIISAKIEFDKGRARIVVRTDNPSGRRDHRYDAFTPTELWSAYHLIRPTPEMVAAGARADEVNLVGQTATDDKISYYAVHPALRPTPLARDGIRLDNLAALEVDPEEPAAKRWRECPWYVPFGRDWSALQWYDEEAVVTVQDGVVYVESAQGPADFLLRCKLWQVPEYYREAGDPQKRGEAVQKHYSELLDRLVEKEDLEWREKVRGALDQQKRIGELDKKATKDAKEKDPAEADRLFRELLRNEGLDKSDSYRIMVIESLVRALEADRLGFSVGARLSGRVLDDAVNAKVEESIRREGLEQTGAYRLRLLVQRASDEIDQEFNSGPAKYLQEGSLRKINDGFDPFRQVDRFAKTVAVLHWIETQLGPEKLPALPAEIVPVRVEIPPSISIDDVLPK
jgi:hypothetical protein